MGNQASSGVYTGAPPPRKAKPLHKDMEEAWKLIGACVRRAVRGRVCVCGWADAFVGFCCWWIDLDDR